MLRIVAAVLLLTGALGPLQQTLPPAADIGATLIQAEAAYYEARFEDTIGMLAPLDVPLESQPERIHERIRVKLQLALAHIGLNQLPEAKALLTQLYELDSQFVLDPSQIAPKVLTLLQEASAEHTLKVAETVYTDAVEAYKRGQLTEALSKMQTVLKLDPEHHLAAQYIDLIDGKLRLSMDRIAFDWHTHYDAHDFPRAAESYLQLLSFNTDDKAAPWLYEIVGEYRKALGTMAQSWRQACSLHDQASMDQAQTQAKQVVPDAVIGRDILDEMNNCTAKPSEPVQTTLKSPPTPELPQECIKALPANAMLRLKTRVDPEIPDELGRSQALRVRAIVRIDENGNTAVHGLQGGSPAVNRAVQAAVRNWKFYPAIVNNQPRCVETELPITLNR